jgi:4'-phosphopantetheinyl transferase
MVAAVIAPHPVGIDVERIHSRKDGLFEAVATDDEWRLVDGKDWETLYRVWTAKEAVLKAAGIGLVGLDDCRIVEVLGPKRWRLAYGTQPIDIEHFALDHHVAAVTVGPEPIRWVVAMHPGPCPVCHIG